MDIQFMKDYYEMRYEERDGEHKFIDKAAFQEKEELHSALENKLMEMVGGAESDIWKLYERIMCVCLEMEELTKQSVYLQGAYDREQMLK